LQSPQMTKRERVDAALAGQPVDRVPVSAWRLLTSEERDVQSLAAATLDFHQNFDWDWIKINPRVTMYAEAWGNQYAFEDYAGSYPRLISGPVTAAAEVERIQPLSPSSGIFDEHLALLRLVGQGAEDTHYLQTVFSPLSVLAFLAEASEPAGREHSAEQVVRSHITGIRRLIDGNPRGVHEALAAITETLAAYSSLCVDAGASGIFYAIVRMARRNALSREEYAT
jgi:uroporphyrinogen decarboxylase